MSLRCDSVPVHLSLLLLLAVPGCNGDDPVTPAEEDATPPAAVSDLSIQSIAGATVTVAWTAPGDDGTEGTATQYDLRWAHDAITDANWNGAASVTNAPSPAAAGSGQTASFDVSGTGDVYVALKTADEVPNWSGMSNLCSVATNEVFAVHQLTSRHDNTHPYVRNGVVVWVRDLGADGEEIYTFDLEDPTSIITRRTGSGGEKRNPSCIGLGYLVWSGREHPTADWEMHTCNTLDMCQLTQYTDNDFDDEFPMAIGVQEFVWVQRNGFYGEIMHHAMGYVDSPISDDCCPIPEYSTSNLDASGDWVVWRSVDATVSEYRAYMKNMYTGVLYDLTDTIHAATATEYSIDDGKLAYEGAVGAEIWVQYWDGSNVHEIEEGSWPSLSEGRVAYNVRAGSDWDVHYWDGTTIHPIAAEQTNETLPCLDGDWLVWVGDPGDGSKQIYYTRVRN